MSYIVSSSEFVEKYCQVRELAELACAGCRDCGHQPTGPAGRVQLGRGPRSGCPWRSFPALHRRTAPARHQHHNCRGYFSFTITCVLVGRLQNVRFQFPPWQIYERNGKGKVVRHTGLVLELAKELGNRLNFRFFSKFIAFMRLERVNSTELCLYINSVNIVEPPDGKWGSRLSFSRWTGMVEQVRTGSVAFAAAGFTVTADRMSAVNFSLSLDAQPYTFMFARPKQLSRAYLFIQPYTPNVRVNMTRRIEENLCVSLWLLLTQFCSVVKAWITIFGMTLGAGPLIWFFNRITPYYQFYPDRPGSPIFSIWYNIWYCIGALFYQGMASPQLLELLCRH